MDARTKLYAVALAVAATISVSGPAVAQDRHDRGRHEGPAYRTPHWVYDNRYHHGHYYPAPGYAVSVLPPGYVSVHFGNRAFFFHGGVWYQPAGPRFVVVRPPVGIVVPVLPPAYSVVWVGGVPYYYANDVYYVQTPSGYAVTTPPPEQSAVASAPPPAPQTPNASPQASAGLWYYCEPAHAYYPYVAQCTEPWKQVPATPPPAR